MRSPKYGLSGRKTLEILEFAKNYNKWIAAKLLPHITLPAIEIGAGTGNLTSIISQKITTLHISDVDAMLVTHLRKKFTSKKHQVIKLNIEQDLPEKFLNTFATVYSVNVLEHIENDEKALRNMKKMIQKNGKVVLLVPAKKFLFSNLDKELGHFRRYEKAELVAMIEKVGLRVKKVEYFNIVGLLSWYVRDKIDKKGTHLKPYQIRSFEMIVPILKVLESIISVPIGISLIVVAEKK